MRSQGRLVGFASGYTLASEPLDYSYVVARRHSSTLHAPVGLTEPIRRMGNAA